MKNIFFILFLLMAQHTFAQTDHKIENLIIITTDGFRWQEVFTGMDSAIANMGIYNENAREGIFKKYWADNPEDRRKKLLPFFWNTIGSKGQVYGNRNLGNYVNVANPYWFSYPGYNEIFTGYPDTLVNSNSYKSNPNTNVLAFLNKFPAYNGRVAAFGAWEAFERILNEAESGFPVVNAFKPFGGNNPNAKEKLINNMLKDSYRIFGNGECLDVFTHYGAMEAWKKDKLKIMYIAYGETDEFAHSGKYRSYLDAAHQFDKWLKSIWKTIENNPEYNGKTALFITTDHGRGDALLDSKWTSHGEEVNGADEIWFAVMAPGLIKGKGEIREKGQYYQKQFAQTLAGLLGYEFKANHPVAEAVKEIYK